MASQLTVRVDHNRVGGWNVTLPGQRDGFTLETLDEAQRVAFLCAAHRHPCELIVRDAYDRVLHREFIDGGRVPSPDPPADIESR